MTGEKDNERQLIALCQEHGAICWKFASPGMRGVPDRLCITIRGFVFFVELKSAKGRLSVLQMQARNRLSLHSTLTLVIDSPTSPQWNRVRYFLRTR